MRDSHNAPTHGVTSWHQLAVKFRPTASLRSYSRNARRHPKKQIRQIANSIEKFGFNNPILITSDGEVIAGHGRLEAAKLLGLEEVPTICLSHLSDEERRAYILADNKIALNSSYDTELLALEFADLAGLGVDLSLTGFSMAEVDLVIDTAQESDPSSSNGSADALPQVPAQAVTRCGDLWQMGRHVLICGDAREPEDYRRLMFDELADLIFCDPPYGCKIDGHVSGLGRLRHREFIEGSGLSEEELTAFLGSGPINRIPKAALV